MNAPKGIKHCASCDNEIDDAQTYCSGSCARVAELELALSIERTRFEIFHKEFRALQESHKNGGCDDLLEACKEGLEVSKFAAALNLDESVGNTQEFLDELYKMLDHFQGTARAAVAKAEQPK